MKFLLNEQVERLDVQADDLANVPLAGKIGRSLDERHLHRSAIDVAERGFRTVAVAQLDLQAVARRVLARGSAQRGTEHPRGGPP